MGQIDSLLVWAPEMMGNQRQDEFGISRLWQRVSDRGAAPNLKIGEGTEPVRPHPGMGEMLEGGYISVGQDFGVAIG
jgi:hypothetical protein